MMANDWRSNLLQPNTSNMLNGTGSDSLIICSLLSLPPPWLLFFNSKTFYIIASNSCVIVVIFVALVKFKWNSTTKILLVTNRMKGAYFMLCIIIGLMLTLHLIIRWQQQQVKYTSFWTKPQTQRPSSRIHVGHRINCCRERERVDPFLQI